MPDLNNPLDDKLSSPFDPALPTLHAYLDHYALIKGDDQVATDAGMSYTWAELRSRSLEFVNAFAAAGVGAGDCVAMLTPPNFDFLACYLACARLGAIWLGINPKYTRSEMAYVIGDARPVLLLGYHEIGGRDYQQDLASLDGPRCICLDRDADCKTFFRGDVEVTLPDIGAETPVLLVYTSGSSGSPKGALISHQSLIKAAQDRIRAWNHTGWRMLLNLPVNHIGGAGDVTCTALVAGGMIAFMAKFDAAGSLDRIEADKLTIWFQVPTQLHLSLDTDRAATADLSSLQAVIWSGAPASRQLVEDLSARFPGMLGLDYSMTESVGAISMVPLGGDQDTLLNTVGYPVPGREFALADSQIRIRDDYMLTGYLGKTSEDTFDADGGFLTGDLGRVDDHGRLVLTGRATDMFKSGGYNVYPREVEQAIEAIDGISMVAVISVPDTVYVDVGHAYVLPEKGAVVASEDITDHLRTVLANYKIPKKIHVRSDLPLLPIGKIDKKALKAALS